MASVLGDALRRFCVEIGWSYAVFWRVVGTQEQRYLIWEEGYCGRMRGGISGFEAMDLLIKEKGLLRGSRYEERISELGRPTEDKIYMLVHKRMASQTHALGDGVIGKAASTGNHQWILQGNFNLSSAVSKDMVEMNQQLMAGIQTIAVIPVLPQGVLQLGSTQLIFEEIGFVNYVRHLFMQPRSMARSHLYDASGTVFNHKSQLPANMQPSISQYGDISSNVNTLLSRSCHGRDLQLFGDYSRFVNKASPVFTSSSLDKMTTRSQQMPLNNNINAKKIMPFNNSSHSTCHVINPNLFSNNLGHPGTFSASNSSIMEKTLPHQSVYESCCQPAGTNGSLFSSHLKSCENHFETYSEAAHESSDSQETIVDGPKLLRSNYESKLSVSRKDSEAALSFGIRDSFNELGNIGSTCSLSNDIMECVKSNISPSNQVSQVLSLTDDLDRVCMFSSYFSQTHSSSTGKKSMTVSSVDKEKDEDEIYQAVDKLTTVADNQGSIERLHHSINHGDQFDTYLVSPTKRDLYGSSALSNGNDSVVVLNTGISPPSSIKININVQQQYSESNLFDLFDLDRASNANYSTWDDSLTDLNSAGFCGLSASLPASINQSGADTFGDVLNDEISCSGGLFPERGSDQLLEAIVSHVKPTVNLISADNVFYDTGSTKTSNLLHSSIPQCNVVDLSEQLPGNFEGLSSISTQSQTVDANSLKSECSIDRSEGVSSLGNDRSKSQISLWVGKARNLNRDRSSAVICKRVDDVGKSNKKRSRIGENPRPRPKDRQMIQDRVKELREIVPNGAKMSIDALLEKTIKHMLFLQSVTKHADKLKEAGKKPKILGGEEGQVLHKDNFLGSGGGGGATWAFEVGSQSVVCPIIVENLSTPRHMLVEMICEKRGLFLEIADLIRGLGFTILKGVMESRNDKVWAQFAVEANRDVTRMEVFLSLVHLLEPAGRDAAALEGGIHYCKKPHNLFHQLTGAADCV